MKESLLASLSKIAILRSVPYCYRCQKVGRTGVCRGCQLDDLMRFMDGVGVDCRFYLRD